MKVVQGVLLLFGTVITIVAVMGALVLLGLDPALALYTASLLVCGLVIRATLPHSR